MPADRRRPLRGLTHWDVVDTPIGALTLVAGEAGLRAIHFPGRAPDLDPADRDADRLACAAAQLREYFAGARTAFHLPLDLGGTPLQRAVWERLQAIPCGTTTTYTRLAQEVGRPGAVRAVGAAVGRTPVPIVVPCHRVLGADGSLTGYAGGLERKRALLDHERST
jgi:methylated-DNA-[protein]-cysteine S-methyltransferase